MQKAILNHGNPYDLETNRIKEIRKLSHLDLLERFFVIREISYKLAIATIIKIKNDGRSIGQNLE